MLKMRYNNNNKQEERDDDKCFILRNRVQLQQWNPCFIASLTTYEHLQPIALSVVEYRNNMTTTVKIVNLIVQYASWVEQLYMSKQLNRKGLEK